ncbi:MAG: N(4)-(beta-N-acetylglucosaminyl)-L-asparaginase [bacterium]
MEPIVLSTWSWGRTACARAGEILTAGGGLDDAIEEGTVAVELDPTAMTVGYGGLPNEDGVVQTDALFMRGSTLEAGAVAALEGIRTPIRVARRVMERTHHVLLAGPGAQRFAIEQGFALEDMLTPAAAERHARFEAEGASPFRRGHAHDHDTVCVIGADGREAIAAVSTSGLGFKMPGRVGDSPLVGAGAYADAEVGVAAATGVGEEILRAVASFAVVERMRAGQHPMAAVHAVLTEMVRRRGDIIRARESQVGLIAVRRDGEIGYGAIWKGFEAPVWRAGRVETLVPEAPLLGSSRRHEDPAAWDQPERS